MTNVQLEIQVAKHTSNFPIAVVQRKALPDICTELVISPKIWSLTMGTYLAFPIKDGQVTLPHFWIVVATQDNTGNGMLPQALCTLFITGLTQ
jgi:hypothetical protein